MSFRSDTQDALTMTVATGRDALTFLAESNYIEGVFDVDSVKQAIEAWQYLLTEKELTPSVILKAHKILMLHHHLRPSERGYFRRCQVAVGGHEKIMWTFIPDRIAQWCHNAMVTISPSGIRFPEEQIRLDHVAFENIHPFVDGNGRIGRMLLNWQRIRSGMGVQVIWEKDKYNYYEWFR